MTVKINKFCFLAVFFIVASDSAFAKFKRNVEDFSCPPINSFPNGQFLPLSQTPYEITSRIPNQIVVGFICDTNYELVPNNELVKCVDGSWNQTIPLCLPKSNLNEAFGEEKELCGNWDGSSQEPWHVGIYQKIGKKYNYFCGGSIVSPNVIVTAAHCLTDDNNSEINPADLSIGAGKHKSDYTYEEWSSQYNTVKKYVIPNKYQGRKSNLEADIALLVLNNPFEISYYVHPACIDWENKFEDEQLAPGSIGSVQGWGYSNLKMKTPSATLQQLNVPVVEKENCLETVPKSFQKYITNDKFCAGYTNGSCICNGDDGGGLVFRKTQKSETKYYIRGLISTYPMSQGACDMYQYAVYTKISAHMDFIQRGINENKVKKTSNN